MDDASSRRRLTPALVLWLLLALLAAVLVLQNSADTTVQVVGWTLQAPLFVVIAAAMVLGWALGTVGTRAWSWRRRRAVRREGDAE
jgi:uncharacterized integral membrane protein